MLRAAVLQHVRRLINTHQLTQERAAELAGCSQPHLCNALAGHKRLADCHVDELIEALQLTGADLFTSEEREALHAWLDGYRVEEPARSRPRPSKVLTLHPSLAECRSALVMRRALHRAKHGALSELEQLPA